MHLYALVFHCSAQSEFSVTLYKSECENKMSFIFSNQIGTIRNQHLSMKVIWLRVNNSVYSRIYSLCKKSAKYAEIIFYFMNTNAWKFKIFKKLYQTIVYEDSIMSANMF